MTATPDIEPSCPACGGPPMSSEAHDDRTCPFTRTPGRVQRGGFVPKSTAPAAETVPLDEDDPWDTSGRLFNVDGWPNR